MLGIVYNIYDVDKSHMTRSKHQTWTYLCSSCKSLRGFLMYSAAETRYHTFFKLLINECQRLVSIMHSIHMSLIYNFNNTQVYKSKETTCAIVVTPGGLFSTKHFPHTSSQKLQIYNSMTHIVTVNLESIFVGFKVIQNGHTIC